MAEWSIAAVLKTVEVRASGGSNPSLSAKATTNQVVKADKKRQILQYQHIVGFFYAILSCNNDLKKPFLGRVTFPNRSHLEYKSFPV